MDFCVRCGRQDVYKEFLCRACYEHVYPSSPQKQQKKQPKQKKDEVHPDYFEAVVQLRKVEPAVHEYVAQEMEKHGITLVKEEWAKSGVDLWVDSSKWATELAKRLQLKFGGIVKTTRTLFSIDKQTSKPVYRFTVLFKQFPYDEGEEFTFKGDVYRVLSVKKDVLAQDKKGGKRRHIRFDELENDRVF